MKKIIDQELLNDLLEQAKVSPRLRQNYDLRTTEADTSQRMLNALQPDTVVPIHKHEETSETVVCLCGRLEEIFYEEVVEYVKEQTSCTEEVMRKKGFKEVARCLLCPAEGKYGIQVPKGAWHTIRVLEPSVIFEAKDGAYK
jgi:hypothetical protein